MDSCHAAVIAGQPRAEADAQERIAVRAERDRGKSREREWQRQVREGSPLPQEAARWVAVLKRADIVIGTPSYNNSSTTSRVAADAAAGVATCFPGLHAAPVNSDGGSSDGTQGVVLAQELPPGVKRLAFTYPGLPGQGPALRATFEVTAALDATACVEDDSDLRGIRPD